MHVDEIKLLEWRELDPDRLMLLQTHQLPSLPCIQQTHSFPQGFLVWFHRNTGSIPAECPLVRYWDGSFTSFSPLSRSDCSLWNTITPITLCSHLCFSSEHSCVTEQYTLLTCYCLSLFQAPWAQGFVYCCSSRASFNVGYIGGS